MLTFIDKFLSAVVITGLCTVAVIIVSIAFHVGMFNGFDRLIQNKEKYSPTVQYVNVVKFESRQSHA